MLGDDQPAKVEPLRIRLKDNARPFRCKARRYSPEKSQFMESFNAELVRLGWVYKNTSSRWASAAMPVKKPKQDGYRQTSDYRQVNSMTEPIAGIMPHLQVALEHCKGKRYFAVFDFLKGFWQLPLAKESQEILSYMTDRGIFTPTRVPQGAADAALHFQQTVEQVLRDLLYEWLLVWIDDILVYADTVEELLDATARMFKALDDAGFKLSPQKSEAFLCEVKWCGRIINKNGVNHDPERIKALQNIPYPINAAELQQFVCATNWMREGLVDYARTVEPLQQRLDTALSGSAKTKRVAAGIKLELDHAEMDAFDAVKALLAHSATLTYPDPQGQLCLLTDASDEGWGLVVTQVMDWKEDTPIHQQHHQLLYCQGGTFRGSERNWSVIEKEAFPIAHACDTLEHILLRPQGFKLYCDHRNIIYMFAPAQELKKHVRGKLQRWATKLLEYRYEIEHIDGIHNVWADLVSRWGGRSTAISSARRLTSRKRTEHPDQATPSPNQAKTYLTRPLNDPDFVWPTLDEIQREQKGKSKPRRATTTDGVVRINNCIWIPEECEALTTRILVIADCGSDGHRGTAVMQNHIQRLFHLHRLVDRVAALCKDCLLCLHVKGGKTIPRPRSDKYRCYERNQALHWDFLTLGESFGTSRYLLVLKDEASHFVELVTCDSPTAEVAAEAILDWHSRYGVPP